MDHGTSRSNCPDGNRLISSCAGPSLYSIYASILEYIVPGNMSLHGYIDDHNIKAYFLANNISEEIPTIRSLKNCANAIKLWPSSTTEEVFIKLYKSKQCICRLKCQHQVLGSLFRQQPKLQKAYNSQVQNCNAKCSLN